MIDVPVTVPPSHTRETQVTRGPGGRILTNISVWSPDSRYIVYDTRSDADGTLFDGDRIEVVDIETGAVRTVYQSKDGAHCGVATFHPTENKVVFILGPEHPTPDWQYGPAHRQGVVVDLDKPGVAVNLDARDLTPPFTPGALRGGSHVHVYSPDGQMVSFTYNDALLSRFTKSGPNNDIDQRNVGLSAPIRAVSPNTSRRNHPGTTFSVLVTRTVANPMPGSDLIQRAYEEGWVGRNGYRRPSGTRQKRALAFLGEVIAPNKKPLAEVLIVDLPEDLTVPGEDGPLEGTETRRPLPPRGTTQRRLTFTANRKYPGVQGPRHWVRSSPDGSQIAFLMRDDAGLAQLWTVSPNGGAPRQITTDNWGVDSAFTWSPDGRQLAYIADKSVFAVEVAAGNARRLSPRDSGSDSPLPLACVISPDGRRVAYLRCRCRRGAPQPDICCTDWRNGVGSMKPSLEPLDVLVLALYLLAVTAFGCGFVRKKQSSDAFMSAGRSLPGWAVGLSLFGSYVSSISFLANPGKSFADNWNAFVFALSIPLACWVAVRWFLPFYRSSGSVSAYEHLEARFGPWARTYAVLCFLLVQIARLGTIVYLLALALQPLLRIDIIPFILLLGVLITVYPMLGGAEAVIWTGVAQAVVLLAGPILCIVVLVLGLPGGLSEIVRSGSEANKFSIGSFAPSLGTSTFWVVLLYGIATNLQNFGIDQAYVQRYITARDDRAAARSVWLGGLLYLPIGAAFFFIGTALFVYYGRFPGLLPSGIKADGIFPYFIQTQLPVGLKGLVLAAICAAAMDSNLNCSATLTLCDLYQRYFRANPSEQEKLRVLRLSTLAFGALSILTAVAMIQVKNALDVWWEMAGALSGGMLGLFLLGRLSGRAGRREAILAVSVGVLLILWMTLSTKSGWPASLAAFRNPFHPLMTLVVGTLSILLTGIALAAMRPMLQRAAPAEPGQMGI